MRTEGFPLTGIEYLVAQPELGLCGVVVFAGAGTDATGVAERADDALQMAFVPRRRIDPGGARIFLADAIPPAGR